MSARAKKSITHQHPSDPNRFMLDTAIGPMHFGLSEDQEIDTAWVDADPILDAPWQKKMVLAGYNAYAFREPTLGFDQGQLIEYVHPDSGESATFQPQQLQWTNDIDQIDPIADPQAVSATIDDDILTWIDAYGSGIDFQWEAQTARLMKLVNIANLTDLPPPPAFIIAGGNPVLKIGFILQKSSGIEIWTDGVLWDEKANNPQTTLDHAEFRLTATGETLWWFRSPLGWDSGGHLDDAAKETVRPAMRLRKSGPNLFVEILTPWDWLQQANYPVSIDVTIDDAVDTGTDDGSSDDFAFRDTDAVAYVGEGPGIPDSNAWFLFGTISGLSGATIDVSHITCNFSRADTDALANIYAEDAVSPNAPADSSDHDGLARTTAFAAWDGESGTGDQQSGSINSVIQELADSYDPSTILLLLDNDSSPGGDYYTIRTYEGSAAWGADLHIEYTAGDGEPTVSESDGVTLGESVTVDPVSPTEVSEADGLTLGETATMELADTNISESDGITLGELVDPELISFIDESDSLTLGENVTVSHELDEEISEEDGLTVGEFIDLELLGFISESDDLTLGETVSVDPVSLTEINESDGITLGDSATVSIPVEGIREINEADGITLGETVTIAPVFNTEVSESDGLTVGEAVTTTVSDPDISVADALTVGEATTLELADTNIAPVDGLTIGDTATVALVGAAPDVDISAEDGITLGEIVTVSGLLGQAGPPWKTRKIERGIEIPEKRILTNIRAQNEQLAEKREKERAQVAFQERREAAKERIVQRDQDAAEYEIRREMRRETSLENLELARMAREEEAKRQKKILAKRKRTLKKARAVKKKKSGRK